MGWTHRVFLDYEKMVRSEEVAELETKVEGLQEVAANTQRSVDAIQEKLNQIHLQADTVDANMNKYDIAPKQQLPEPA